MSKEIPTLAEMTPEQVKQYLYGRVDLPPFCYDSQHRQYPYIYSGSVSVNSNVQNVELDIQIDPDAFFLVEGIEIVSTKTNFDNSYVTIKDSTTNNPWSNSGVQIRDIAGRGDTPKYLSDPRLVFPSATLQLFISNFNNATVTYYVSLHGRKIYGLTDIEASFLMKRQWYQYVLSATTIGASANNVQQTLSIYNDADFLLKKLYASDFINFIVNTASAGSESAEMMWQVKDASSDQNFFSQQLAMRLVVGSQFAAYATGGASFTNAQGFFLKKPIYLRRTATLINTFTNKSTTTTSGVNLTIAFEGCKMYSL